MTTSSSDRPAAAPLDPGPGVEVRAIGVAAAVWAAADLAPPALAGRVVIVVGLFVVGLGLVARWWSALLIGAVLVAGSVGAAAAAAHRPVRSGPIDQVVTVVDDPRPIGFGWAVEVRTDAGTRLEARGYGPAGWDLAEAAVGERWHLTGRRRPPGDRPWLRVNHIVGLIAVDRAVQAGPVGPAWSVPAAARNLVVAGADHLEPGRRALYLGLVIGDDRFQSDGQRVRFRAAGLAHLLAVSGQNVAFVLAVLTPLLERLGRRSRLMVVAGALVIFAVVTRMEPSVMRATATAMLAVWAAATGRARSGLVVLAVAVVALIWIDPFLVDVVGFRLSVAASAGILLLQPAIVARLPGPGWIRRPLATTVAAQAGVSPVLAGFVGPVSAASVPANLLAGWAAAAVMTLGLTVGTVAGVVGAPLGPILQAPTGLLLDWIDLVATWHARAPAPLVGPLGAAVGLVLVLVVRRRRPHQPAPEQRARPDAGPSSTRPATARRGVDVALVVAVAGWLVVATPMPPDRLVDCGTGLRWYPAGGPETSSVLVVDAAADERSVEACLRLGVRSVDLVIAGHGGAGTARTVAVLVDVMAVEDIAAPPQHRIVGARRRTEPFAVQTGVGPVTVRPADGGDRLVVADAERGR
ncbi:MAG: ComEC/Rec2 family competence protein [Actinomycetota bacterium]